jgi:hypothetical protein
MRLKSDNTCGVPQMLDPMLFEGRFEGRDWRCSKILELKIKKDS